MKADNRSDFSILIIEDDAIVAMDIARRLNKIGYTKSDIRDNANDAINYIDIHGPDLVLCDINIYGEKDGIYVAEHIRSTCSTPLIFITALSDRATLDRAKKTLPYGYIVKPFNNRDLKTAIELAMYKYSVELERLKLTKDALDILASEPFSDREYEVLQDIIEGLTNDQIASQRNITTRTVKFHIGNILTKMDVKNRAGALQKVIKMLT